MSTDASTSPTPHLSSARPSPTFIFAGGGSGGHIYPGIAIAEELRRLNPLLDRTDILFVVSDRPLDEKILAATEFPFARSPARPMIGSVTGMFRFLRSWPKAVAHAGAMLWTWDPLEKDVPQLVAMGGFVAAPAVRAAKHRRAGFGVTMVNLDAVPGKANRYIARRADRVFTAARVPRELQIGPPWVEVPPIVRASARAPKSREECRRELGLDPARPVFMVTGGSQGLASINSFVAGFGASPAGQWTLREQRWQMLHQTGAKFESAIRAAYESAGIDAVVVPFTDQMGLWWGASDLAVCTAGAGNIAEIWSNKTPALLLPYPHHKDEHQKFNAAPLAEAGGVVVGKDWIDPTRNLEENGPVLASLLGESPRRDAMRANLEKLGPADGATRIARALLDMANSRS